MKKDCGCCEGIHKSTPAEVSNRPGLPALNYRTGTHAKFLETMKARLSNLYLEDSEPGGKPLPERSFPLWPLKTREADDAAIAFLDAWATVADVLTFYQERIANEGYLRTATERRSVLELARLVGYSLRPGVAASTCLAYTLEKGSAVTIPAGSRAQSVPGPGETLQSFETSEDLAARTEWNTLVPRQTLPQSPDTAEKVVKNALYLKGITSNLKPNDALLVDYGTGPDAQQLFRVIKVEPDPLADRTKVTLALWVSHTGAATAATPAMPATPAGQPATTTGATAKSLPASEGATGQQRTASRERVGAIVAHFSDEKEYGDLLRTSTGRGVGEQLEALRGVLDADETELARVLVEEVLPQLQKAHGVAVEKNFTRLEPWIQQLVAELTASVETTEETSADAKVMQSKDVATGTATADSTTSSTATSTAPASNATAQQQRKNDLDFILRNLDKPRPASAIPPPSPADLHRSVEGIFTAGSDVGTKILTTVRPGLADTLVTALGNMPGVPQTSAKVYAMRLRASVFGHNAPPQNVTDERGRVIGQREWTLVKAGSGAPEDFSISIFFLSKGGTDLLLPAFATSIKIGAAERVDTLLIPKDAVRTNPTPAGLVNEYEFLIHYTAAAEDPIKVTLGVLMPQPTNPPADAPEEGKKALSLEPLPSSLKFEFPNRKVTVTCDFMKPDVRVFATAALDPLNLNFNLLSTEAPVPSIEGQQLNSLRRLLTITGKVLSIQPQATEKSKVVALDAPHPEVLPGDAGGGPQAQESWVALERPFALDGQTSPVLISRVLQVKEISRADYGIAFKTTQLTLQKSWLNPRAGANPNDDIDLKNNSFAVIRGTTVFAQSELLELAEAPIDPLAFPVCGNEIELDALYSGLETGRWLIVTGERADVTPFAPEKPDGNAPSPSLAAEWQASLAREPWLKDPAYQSVQMANTTTEPLPAEQPPVIGGLKTAELVMLAGVRLDSGVLPGETIHTTLLLANSLAYCYKRDTVTIYGNVAHATHGETRMEVLGSGDASQPLQTFTLKQPPLTYVSAQTVSGVESTLQVRVNDILWHEAESMAELGPNDRRFLTRTDDEGKTRVIFGNGTQGARVPTGVENITALYRSGIGRSGNLKAEQISILATKPLGVKEVINPLPATGGADKEDRDTARRNAPLAVMSLDRLVSVQDYADFARTFAGIGKVSAVRLSDGRRQIVFLTIAGADDIPIDETSDLFQNLRLSLQKFGDPFQAIQIKRRLLKLIVISADVCVHPDYLWKKVEPQIRAALVQKFSFAERELGQDVLLSEVISTIQLVEGVLYVDVNTLGWVNEDIKAEELENLAKSLTFRERIPVQMARVDETATNPEERIRPAELAILSPLVTDTLILRNCQP